MTPRPSYPGAGAYVPSRPSRRSLHAAARGCEGCDLYRDATQVVMGDGPARARLVLVGEQPGDVEDREGEPFVGPAGRLLHQALDAAGVSTETAYLTNAVKHFRFERDARGKRRIHKTPSAGHVVACRPWLVAELKVTRPEGVVLLGATAAHAVLGMDFRLTERRGRLEDWPQDWPGVVSSRSPVPRWALATVHPSAVLRSRERETDFDALVADLTVVADALARPQA
ncbi:UdgX family uracil-DNA binding protein [Mumia quercus]|uniref:UdgX family uracil-DNA binding protein n=1 Tax=Mumia quercus TaxID=2976125 RepID=UPI0021D3CE20|nr:UdgX family uracil-DNA binding protein [Mumia quercus]